MAQEEWSTHVIDDHVHDGFGDKVALRFVNDLHVRVDEVANRLHLSLHLRVHRRQLLVSLQTQGQGCETEQHRCRRGEACSTVIMQVDAAITDVTSSNTFVHSEGKNLYKVKIYITEEEPLRNLLIILRSN